MKPADRESAGSKLQHGGMRVFMYPPERFSLYAGCDKARAPTYKYAHGLFLIERLRKHPWRVASQADADIAVVPMLVDWLVRGFCADPVTGRRDQPISRLLIARHLANASSIVNHSSQLRHVIVLQDYAAMKVRLALREAFPNLTLAFGVQSDTAYTHPHWALCQFGIGFTSVVDMLTKRSPFTKRPWSSVGLAESSASVDQSELVLRTIDTDQPRSYLLEFSGGLLGIQHQFHHDRMTFWNASHAALEGRPIFVVTHNRGTLSAPSCSLAAASGTDCHRYPNFTVRDCAGTHDTAFCHFKRYSIQQSQRYRSLSNFSIVFHGDDFGGDRVINAIAAKEIPVIIGKESYEVLPFHGIVPWHELALRIERDTFELAPATAVMKAIKSTVLDIPAVIQKRIEAHWPDLLWSHSTSRVEQNMLRAAARVKCSSQMA